MLQYGFGALIGRIVGFLYIWFAIHLGALVLRNFGEFFVTVGLVDTPQLVPVSVFAILCLWGIKEGLEVLGRWSNIVLRITILVILSTLLMLTIEIDFNNFLPVLYKGFTPVVRASFSVLTFPFVETVIFLMVFSSFQEKASPYKIYLIGLLIGGTILFVTSSSQLGVLGSELYVGAYFPAYRTVARINIGGFLQRLEILAAISFMGGGFIKISMSLLAASRGLAKLLNFDDYRFVVTPLTFFMVSLSFLLYDSIMEMNRWAVEVWPFYAFPFQVIIPVLLWIVCELKVRLQAKT